jgi:hypothetical protein
MKNHNLFAALRAAFPASTSMTSPSKPTTA